MLEFSIVTSTVTDVVDKFINAPSARREFRRARVVE